MDLKQSTAVDIKVGPFLDATDGITAETALTITQPDIRLAKNNGAWAQKNTAGTATHEENGWYEVALDATDTDTLGILMLAVHEAGAVPVNMAFNVISANEYTHKYGSTLQPVNATAISGDTVAADNVEAAYDGAGYAGGTIKQIVDLASTGMDAVIPRTGFTAKQAMGYCLDVLCGKLSGAATTTIVIKSVADGTTTTVTATVDADGNRSAVVLS